MENAKLAQDLHLSYNINTRRVSIVKRIVRKEA